MKETAILSISQLPNSMFAYLTLTDAIARLFLSAKLNAAKSIEAVFSGAAAATTRVQKWSRVVFLLLKHSFN